MDMDTAQNISSKTAQHSKFRMKPAQVIVLFILLILIISACILYFLYFANGNKRATESQRSAAPSNTIPAAGFNIPTPTVTPTSTIALGPGPYACDPLGICNHYADAVGIGCPKTYADPQCLGACGDASVRCPK